MPDHARALSDRAIDLMREYKAAPTPPQYELWFNYASGLNHELIDALDTAVQDGHATDAARMRDLHMRFFGGNLTTAVDDMGAKLQEELQRFAHVLENTGQDTASYGKTLSIATQQLHHGDVAQFKLVIEGVVAATRAIEAKHKALEKELTTSSSEIKSLRQRLESIREESRVDSLTGLLNRRGFDERMIMALCGVAENNDQLCVLIGDVDHFKKFNDTWGHATGDQVLRLVAQCFKSNTKGGDTAARYGGEEFVVALPQTSLEGAITVAEHIRVAVESKKIVKRSTGETLGSITLSIGVAKHVPGEPIEDTLNRADACLYAAKRSGRNRVVGETTLNATELAMKTRA
ncbi:MAG: GGDEF domain-containing protein [Micropepsaceae bacterium]